MRRDLLKATGWKNLTERKSLTSRRVFLSKYSPPMLASLASLTLATCSGNSSKQRPDSSQSASPQTASSQTASQSSGGQLAPTPACGEQGPTPPQTAGPFFTPDSPERASLLTPDVVGTRVVLTGQVLTVGCAPVPNALLDFWQADDQGRYDNQGYNLRGHQYADAEGRYRLETVLPGIYPGRTRHFHVKVQAPSQPVLITQLYLPEEALNQRDGLFQPELLVTLDRGDEQWAAAFDFVLSA